jgi:tryptophan synthase beta subunit
VDPDRCLKGLDQLPTKAQELAETCFRRGQALAAFEQLCRTEGIIPAIESSHALALLPRLAEELGPDAVVIVTVSGRGDKDVDIVREAGLGAE